MISLPVRPVPASGSCAATSGVGVEAAGAGSDVDGGVGVTGVGSGVGSGVGVCGVRVGSGGRVGAASGRKSENRDEGKGKRDHPSRTDYVHFSESS